MNFKPRTDFIFSRPSLLVGMGSAFNLFGNYFLYNTSKTPKEADRRALANDKAVVSQDARIAASQALSEFQKKAA
jgi:hypothetical protein